MAVIKVKRGLQSKISLLVLEVGEFAFATDTGNLYVGATEGKIHINPTGGESDTAVRLKSPRQFSATGDVSAPAVSFDGTQNIQLVLALKDMAGLTAGTFTKLTVNNKGIVTAGTALAVADLPNIPATKITGIGNSALKDVGTAVGNIVAVEASGKINPSLMPTLAITDTFVVSSQVAMLALTAEVGDVAVRTDINKSFILKTSPATILGNWVELKTPDCKVISVNGKIGAVNITYADIASPADIIDGGTF